MGNLLNLLATTHTTTELSQTIKAANVLVLFDEEITLLGDCCVMFDKFKLLKAFFNADRLDVNFTKWNNRRFVESLLFNNRFVSNISYEPWVNLDFENYQFILVISYDEERLFNLLQNKYHDKIKQGTWSITVNSVSSNILKPVKNATYVFPVNSRLNNFVNITGTSELYVSEGEEEWANEWLRSKGLEADEQLVVMIDSSAVKSKLLKANVYFEFLEAMLKKSKTKVLVFDERNIGKQEYYTDWLGNKAMQKIIFSKNMTLRQDLSLLSSNQIKMVFGPCSGLMHCASSIYNHFKLIKKNRGYPHIIVYTGLYGNVGYNLNLWWGESPLVNCLFLKEVNDEIRIFTLSELERDERDNISRLPCSAYTRDVLLDFIDRRLGF